MLDSGVSSLGHRRWVLDPATAVMGSGSTGESNTLFVLSPFPQPEVAPRRAVAWPSPGWVPWTWIDDWWSVSLGAPGEDADFSRATISMRFDGKPVVGGPVEPVESGFGTGAVLKWRPNLPASAGDGDTLITVKIDGATVDGLAAPLSWTVIAFDPSGPGGQVSSAETGAGAIGFGDAGVGGAGGPGTPTGTAGSGGGGTPVGPAASGRPGFARGPFVRRLQGRKVKVPVGRRVRSGTLLTVAAVPSRGRVAAYKWLRDGRPIRGATRSVYVVRAADRGRRISVRVTVRGAGGRIAGRTSPAVRI